jgi:hypothetical protein
MGLVVLLQCYPSFLETLLAKSKPKSGWEANEGVFE